MAGVFRKTALKGFDHVGAARKVCDDFAEKPIYLRSLDWSATRNERVAGN
jgi:glyoxylase-like metal-dependent hydrolase (beta-lactamase superfamily II)